MTAVACLLVLGKDAGISQVISLSPDLSLVPSPLLLPPPPPHFFSSTLKLFNVDENFPGLSRPARARRYATVFPVNPHE